VAADAGVQALRHDQQIGRGRKDQIVLRLAGAEVDLRAPASFLADFADHQIKPDFSNHKFASHDDFARLHSHPRL
jgi:hypothetical protein